MPAIVAPVMRNLGIADLPRAIAFYRDQLGFAITNEREGYAESTCGPARLEFGAHDYDPLSCEGPKPPGTAIVYFEVDDVAAMRGAILARGCRPAARRTHGQGRARAGNSSQPSYGESANSPCSIRMTTGSPSVRPLSDSSPTGPPA